jgi:SAM-dependent methyltransferase
MQRAYQRSIVGSGHGWARTPIPAGSGSYTRAMHDKKSDARRWFDRRAGSYESGVTSRWRDPIQQASLDALHLGAEDRLLDVGCGTGAASRSAASLAASVIGIDLSPEMIRQARDLAEGIGNVQFEIADSEHLPFGDGTFTAVLCSNSFHHYPDPRRAVREMARVLAPSGRIVVGDACGDLATARIADAFLRRFEPGHVRLYRSGELGSFLQDAGLSRVELRRLSGGGFAMARGIAA